MTLLLPRMYEKNSPSVFYNRIRPFLSGTTSADLPDGVFYEDGEGGGELVKLKGPTAAQSSLFHLLDEALGVRHGSTGDFLQVSSHPSKDKHSLILNRRCEATCQLHIDDSSHS